MIRFVKFALGLLVLLVVAVVIRLALGTRPLDPRTATVSTLVNLEGHPEPERDMTRLRLVVARVGWARGAASGVHWPPADAQLDIVGGLLAQIGRYNADIVIVADAPFAGPHGLGEDFAREIAIESGLSHTVSTSTWSRTFVPTPILPPGAWTGGINGGHAIITRYPIADPAADRGPAVAAQGVPAAWGLTPAATTLQVQTGPERWLTVVVRDSAGTAVQPPHLAPPASNDTVIIDVGSATADASIANDTRTIGVALPDGWTPLRTVSGATFDGLLADPVLFAELQVGGPQPAEPRVEGSGTGE